MIYNNTAFVPDDATIEETVQGDGTTGVLQIKGSNLYNETGVYVVTPTITLFFDKPGSAAQLGVLAAACMRLADRLDEGHRIKAEAAKCAAVAEGGQE